MIRTHRVTLRAYRARIFPNPSFLGLETKSTMQWKRFDIERSCSPLARSCSVGRSTEQGYSKVRSAMESGRHSVDSASETRDGIVGATSTVLGAATGAMCLNAKRPPPLLLLRTLRGWRQDLTPCYLKLLLQTPDKLQEGPYMNSRDCKL
jgi:hypothetical protein